MFGQRVVVPVAMQARGVGVRLSSTSGVVVTESGEVEVPEGSGIKWVSLVPEVPEVDVEAEAAAAARRRVGAYLKMSRRQFQRRFKRLYKSTLKLAGKKKRAKVDRNSVRIREMEMFMDAMGDQAGLRDSHMARWDLAKPTQSQYLAQQDQVAAYVAEWKDIYAKLEQERETKGEVLLDIFKDEFEQ